MRYKGKGWEYGEGERNEGRNKKAENIKDKRQPIK